MLSTEERRQLQVACNSERVGDRVWKLLSIVDDLCTVTLTAAAEAGNAIAVTINVTDLNGNAVARAQRLHCHLRDAAMLDAVAASFTMAETGAGSAVSTTTKPSLLIDTDASGDATVTVTDVSGSFAGTVYLEVQPLPATGSPSKSGLPAMIALTFA